MNSIDIANNALLYLGANSISSFEEDDPSAALCKQFYTGCRNSVFRDHHWNSAIKRVVLSPTKEKPIFGYANQFILPSDYIRTIKILCNLDYVIEGNLILTNSDTINLVYVFENNDVNTWDDLLIEAVSLSLTAKLAYPITKSVSKEEAIKGDLDRLLRKARVVNGQEKPQDSLNGYPLLQSRQ